jgi:hypothetical protein
MSPAQPLAKKPSAAETRKRLSTAQKDAEYGMVSEVSAYSK